MDENNRMASSGDDYANRLNRLVTGLDHEDGLKLNFAVYLVEDAARQFVPPDFVRYPFQAFRLTARD